MEVTVCVATYGDSKWEDLAHARAIRSVPVEIPVSQVHGETLAQARNEALAGVSTEWVVYLDADDELEDGYLDAMASGAADLRAPSVRYVRQGRLRSPYVPKVVGHTHTCTADCLAEGNWLVIGTAVRAEMLRDAGGWHDYPCYEDWDAWLRCWRLGATVEAIPSAVYRAHVDPESRNRGQAMAFKNRVHRQIVAANFPVREVA